MGISDICLKDIFHVMVLLFLFPERTFDHFSLDSPLENARGISSLRKTDPPTEELANMD
jgi:hypothetical protein